MSSWNEEDARVESLHKERWKALGFTGLLPFERDYIGVWWLVGDTMNGGLDQFFDNSSGDLAEHALAGLEAAGATQTLAILREAMSLIPGGWCADRADRWKRRQGMHEDALEPLTERFYEYPEDVLVLAIDVVRREYRARGLLPPSPGGATDGA